VFENDLKLDFDEYLSEREKIDENYETTLQRMSEMRKRPHEKTPSQSTHEPIKRAKRDESDEEVIDTSW
jgi:hypothetical protein